MSPEIVLSTVAIKIPYYCSATTVQKMQLVSLTVAETAMVKVSDSSHLIPLIHHIRPSPKAR